MGLEFLERVRKTSLFAGVVAALFAAVYFRYLTGVGVFAGAAWSLLNLSLLERIVTTLTGADRGRFAALQRVALALLGSFALFVAGAFLLVKLPVVALVTGFTLPFGVMVLKAASAMLLGSRAWKRFTASRWRPAVLVALLVAGVWFATDQISKPRLSADETHAAVTTTEAPAAHEAAPAVGAEHAAEGAHEGAAHAEKKKGGTEEFPNLFALILESNESKPWVQKLIANPDGSEPTHEQALTRIHATSSVAFALLVAVLLTLLCLAATRSRERVPSGITNVVETLVEKLEEFVISILGPKYGPKFVPFLGTLFLYIWFMNLFGLFPFMSSPTSNLNVTLALALTVVVYVHFTAIKELGFLGWLDHLAGSPRSPVEWGLVPLMLPIHVIGELAKPVSLSCRLFGNIFGEDMLLAGFAALGMMALSATGLPFGLPLHFPFLFLALMTSTIQALVFTMLSTIYFLLMLPHDDHGHGHEQEAHHPAH